MKTILQNLLRKKTFIIFIIFTLFASTTGSILFYARKDKTNETNNPQVLSAQTAKPAMSEPPEDVNTLDVLLLGYGGAGHSGGYLTDVIQVVHFDFDKKETSFISIPRDLWIKLPNNTSAKINKAFTLGNSKDLVNSGAQISKQMVKTVTGIDADYFISIDFVGFKRAIGYELKGITVNVPEALDDPWYPISGKEQDACGKSAEEIAELTSQYSGFKLESKFECRYDHIHFSTGEHQMDGGDALAYVRSRHGSVGGDFSRSKRQQALLLGIKDKLFQLDSLNNIPGFFKQMIKHVNTDLDIEAIKYIAPLLQNTKDFKTKNITLSTQNVLQNSKSNSGQYIVIPKNGLDNWTEVIDYVNAEINK